MIMILIVSLMLLGMFIGFFVFSRDKFGKLLKICGLVQQIATVLLLFVMGLWLGGNSEFWSDVRITGLYGLLFALVTIVGSVAAVFFLSGPLSKEEKN